MGTISNLVSADHRGDGEGGQVRGGIVPNIVTVMRLSSKWLHEKSVAVSAWLLLLAPASHGQAPHSPDAALSAGLALSGPLWPSRLDIVMQSDGSSQCNTLSTLDTVDRTPPYWTELFSFPGLTVPHLFH